MIRKPKSFRSWVAMMDRCNRPGNASYKNYGGRGIKVCERWHTYEGFLADMGPCEEDDTIDRIDVNGHYEKENCRWLRRDLQNRRRRNTVMIEYKGRVYCRAELASEHGLLPSVLRHRLSKGLDVEQALALGDGVLQRSDAEIKPRDFFEEAVASLLALDRLMINFDGAKRA